jgi:hypothetical protein
MLYIASDQKERNAPTEMGEKESRQVGRSLSAMAEAPSRTAESRNVPVEEAQPEEVERLSTEVAAQTPFSY